MGSKIYMFKDAKIDTKGSLFDIDEIYKHAHDWLDWRKFDIVEKKYKQKMDSGGREIKIEWECTRDIDEYTQFEIDVKWSMYGINDVKMKHENKDIKLQSGNIVIEITVYLVMDYNAKWETSRFNKFMKAFYEKYLYANETERLKSDLWKMGWDFYNEMKAYLNLYNA
jgi:hypothetical protein